MQKVLFDNCYGVRRSAEISECGQYRWWLRRSYQLWDDAGMHVYGKGTCCFIMLNPSKADGTQDDPTIRRCIGFAKSWGYDTLSVRNLFPYRSTDPQGLKDATCDITGGERGRLELLSALTANLVVLAWGSWVPLGRDAYFLDLAKSSFPDKPLYCLRKSSTGKPWHPLYVKADTQPILFHSSA